MKKELLIVVFMVLAAVAGFGQGAVNIPIVKTGEIVDEETQETLSISTDDAEQENNEMDALDDDDLDAGWEGEDGDANILTTGLRFQNVNIPKGATIDSAYIVVYSHEGKSAEDVSKITIVGEANDNPETYTLDALITDRPATTASVLWTVDYEWIIYFPYKTPELKGIVQEIVNREGWVAGNAMAFMLKGEDQGASVVENAREFESFENIEDPDDLDHLGEPGDGKNHPDRVPRLVVYYDGGTTAIKQQNALTLQLYPSPSVNKAFNVNLPSNGFASIQLIDLAGNVVKILNAESNHVSIDASDLPTGMYIVKASQNNQFFINKIVLK